jgi:hypothetical protein
MHVPKNFFHDRMVLLLLSVNTFLTLIGSVLILLRLDAGRPDGYVVQYRSDLGLSAFKTGGATTFISFIVFMLFVLVFHTVLSMRVYPIRRQLAVTIMALAALLIVLAIIVSNALLVLR